MTLEHHGFGEWDLLCDSCGTSESHDHMTFNDVREYLKDEGWRSIRKGQDWEHKCPSCIEEGK